MDDRTLEGRGIWFWTGSVMIKSLWCLWNQQFRDLEDSALFGRTFEQNSWNFIITRTNSRLFLVQDKRRTFVNPFNSQQYFIQTNHNEKSFFHFHVFTIFFSVICRSLLRRGDNTIKNKRKNLYLIIDNFHTRVKLKNKGGRRIMCGKMYNEIYTQL